CGSPSLRLENDDGIALPHLLDLLGQGEAGCLIGDDDRSLELAPVCITQQGFLNQATAAQEGEELLGIGLTGKRPKTMADTAGKNDRHDRVRLCRLQTCLRSTRFFGARVIPLHAIPLSSFPRLSLIYRPPNHGEYNPRQSRKLALGWPV